MTPTGTPAPRLARDFLRLPLAHRGLHDRAQGRPENSLAAFRAAIAAGFGIELDVQPSADGGAMVFHDETLDRLTARKGPVAALPAEELGRIPLSGGEEGIPTLAQVLALVAGRVPLLIELKDQSGSLSPGHGPDAGRLEAAVAAELADYDGPVAVMSFNPHSMARLQDQAPGVARGLVTCDFAADDWPGVDPADLAALRGIPDLERVGGSFISHDVRDLDAPAVARIAGAGHDILCWTVRSAAQEGRARDHAQGITFEGYTPAIP